jgi:DNA adenine methylase
LSRFFPYLGGKHQLAKRIIAAMPEHRKYCEVFGGSGAVLLAKSPSKEEIFNDINGHVINLFRIIKHHPDEFMKEVRWQLHSRQIFKESKDALGERETDIQRAARFYYLMRSAWAAKLPHNSNFNTGTGSARLSIYRIEENLYEIHRRLEKTIIEKLPWQACLLKYDAEDALFFLDPPYYGCERDYGGPFERKDFTILGKCLEDIKGKFILTINNLPVTKELFGLFQIKEEPLKYFISGRPQSVINLIVSNC